VDLDIGDRAMIVGLNGVRWGGSEGFELYRSTRESEDQVDELKVIEAICAGNKSYGTTGIIINNQRYYYDCISENICETQCIFYLTFENIGLLISKTREFYMLAGYNRCKFDSRGMNQNPLDLSQSIVRHKVLFNNHLKNLQKICKEIEEDPKEQSEEYFFMDYPHKYFVSQKIPESQLLSFQVMTVVNIFKESQT